jgi:hypothetical protein
LPILIAARICRLRMLRIGKTKSHKKGFFSQASSSF